MVACQPQGRSESILLARLLALPAAARRLIGLLILGIAVLILPWMAVQPVLAPPGVGGADKFLHAFCFAGLALVGVWAFSGFWARGLMLLILLALGAGIEWAQMHVPGRQGSLGDLAADAAGLLGALILLRCWPVARDVLSRDSE